MGSKASVQGFVSPIGTAQSRLGEKPPRACVGGEKLIRIRWVVGLADVAGELGFPTKL